MGSPLSPKYILYSYMEPLGNAGSRSATPKRVSNSWKAPHGFKIVDLKCKWLSAVLYSMPILVVVCSHLPLVSPIPNVFLIESPPACI